MNTQERIMACEFLEKTQTHMNRIKYWADGLVKKAMEDEGIYATDLIETATQITNAQSEIYSSLLAVIGIMAESENPDIDLEEKDNG